MKTFVGGATVGESLNRGLEIYKKNFVAIFVASLLAGLIGSVTCGICSAPLACGVYAMLLVALRDGSAKIEIGDVFKGFQKFLPALVSVIVLGLIQFAISSILSLIPLIGLIASVVVSVAFGAVSSWALLLVADQDATIGDAIGVPLKLLGDKRFWNIVLITFVAGLIGAAGAIACGIGLLVTIPLSLCIVAAAYEKSYTAAPAPAPEEAPAS